MNANANSNNDSLTHADVLALLAMGAISQATAIAMLCR